VKATSKIARHNDMAEIFERYRGSKAWAARKLDVNRSTITRYLEGGIPSRMLDDEMPRIAALLTETGGRCIDSANGKSVRSQLRRLRARRKRSK